MFNIVMGGSTVDERGFGSPEKSQVAIGSNRNNGTDLLREAIGPLGSNCFSREVRTTLCAIR